MKKLFFIAAIASAAFVSCTKNEVVSFPEQEITFAAPVVAPATKSTNEVWNNYPQDTKYDFAVWARYYEDGAGANTGTYTTWDAGKEYMKEVVVSYGDATWKPGMTYYWPKNGALTFIAYAPATKASYAEASGTGITFTNYDVTTTVAEQVDLLFSERAYNKKAVDDDTVGGSYETQPGADKLYDPYKGVHLAFNHALSSVAFTIRTAEDYSASTTITLNKIELLTVGSTASFDQKLGDSNNAATTAAAWTTPTATANYIVDNNDFLNVELSTTPYWTATKSATAPTATDGLRTTDFILLPQDISSVKLRVTYTLDNNDTGSVALTQVIEKDLAVAGVDAWEMGKRYIYNISLGLDTIYFEPYVAPWEDVTIAVPEI
ncbi:MAG: fimbrillin family protein [Bacteroidales bacterium]|nr:fimbrillin family protein [Bacteroidales bacterium]